MKTKCLLLSLLLLTGYEITFAHHGKGGAIIYEYLGTGSTANTSKYRITVQHYIDCERTADEPSQIYLGIFDGSSNSLVTTVTIPRTGTTPIQKTTFNPCINPVPTVCFYLDTYVTTVELADNTGGYTLAEQECCRADEIVNVSNPSSVGFTNLNTIPGIINGVVYRNNSSPSLVLKDTAVICHSSSFYIDFGATDPDGDVLSYAFCAAKATSSTSRQPNPPSSPPYTDVPYASGYSGGSPMGSGVTIDPVTGLISGIAPATTGEYIISVCITETRNGVPVSVTKKEVLVTVADCSLTAASLATSYINCDNFTFTFSNTSSSSDITSWLWDFGVASSATDISTLSNPTYTYPDTGTYSLKLKVSNSSGCVDSTTSTVKVYPGFTPGFTVAGSCYQSPFQFTDATYVKYGTISSWSWDFGEATTATDISSIKNPSYQYSAPGTFTATLNVTSSKGCSDTVTHTVTANDKPSIYLPFTDTLICSIDSLPLRVVTDGASYSWTPVYNIINPGTANPVVYPKDTTVYTVTVKDKGCVDSASVTVNVLDFITVTLPTDTTICVGDSVQLQPVSYALQYAWSPQTALSNPNIKYPMAAPASDIVYEVTANLGKCQDKASILVKTVPYPQAHASADATICYGTSTQLQGSMTASDFTWSPAATLINAGTLQPVAAPLATTAYILTVTDTLGCPKPVSDTVVVNVIPQVIVFAGNDTSIVLNQPLQLQANSNNNTASYAWSPATGMSDAFVADPVVLFGNTSLNSITYTVTATTAEGCQGTDDVTVKIFKTLPDLFVPNAFTPNQDGLNDVFRPVMAGIAKLDFFRVFNRWGQLVFATSEPGKGWDGSFHGGRQDTGTFVYVIEGVDYTGKMILKKGTVVLLR